MRTRLIPLVGIFVSLVIPSSPGAYQGLELGRDCRGGDDVSRARCEGFINGFLAGAQVDVGGEPINMWRSNGYSWCGPTDLGIDAAVEALFESARTGTATPHFPAHVMLAQALNAKYPCQGLSLPGFPRLGLPADQDR